MDSNLFLYRWGSAFGRALLALIFLVSGFSKVPHWSATASMMAGKGVPASNVLLAIAILIEILCGALLITGNRARFAAGLLFLYLIPVTLTFHNFWAYQGAEQQMQLVNFMKNLAIMGGLLHVVALGAGGYSIDSLRQNYTPELKPGERPKLRSVS